MPFYQARLHCSGFRVAFDGEDVIGFLTVRNVWAQDDETAKSKACEKLRSEPKVASIISETENQNSVRIDAEEIQRITLLSFLRKRKKIGLILYGEGEEG